MDQFLDQLLVGHRGWRGARSGEAVVLIGRQGDAMASKFERERSQVELLMQRLVVAPAEYLDRQAGGDARDETEAADRRPTCGDSGRPISTADIPRAARAGEAKLARDAERHLKMTGHPRGHCSRSHLT
jgi:hypothetical protein